MVIPVVALTLAISQVDIAQIRVRYIIGSNKAALLIYVLDQDALCKHSF